MASGDTLLIGDPLAGRPPASAGARLDLRNGQPVLDFQDASPEAVDFAAVTPNAYAGGGVEVRLAWLATSGVSGPVRWGASIERRADAGATAPHDLDVDAFGAEQAVTTSAPAVPGQIATSSLTFPAAALSAGEGFRLRVRRIADHATDVLAGDAELLALEVREV